MSEHRTTNTENEINRLLKIAEKAFNDDIIIRLRKLDNKESDI